MQKVLLAMQGQQQKQLELIVAIGEKEKLTKANRHLIKNKQELKDTILPTRSQKNWKLLESKLESHPNFPFIITVFFCCDFKLKLDSPNHFLSIIYFPFIYLTFPINPSNVLLTEYKYVCEHGY